MRVVGSLGVLAALFLTLVGIVSSSLVTASRGAGELVDQHRETLAVVDIQERGVVLLRALMFERGWSEVARSGEASVANRLSAVRRDVDVAVVELGEVWRETEPHSQAGAAIGDVVINAGSLASLRSSQDEGESTNGQAERRYDVLVEDLVDALGDLNLTLSEGGALRNRRAAAELIDTMASLGRRRLLVARFLVTGARLSDSDAALVQLVSSEAAQSLARYEQLIAGGLVAGPQIVLDPTVEEVVDRIIDERSSTVLPVEWFDGATEQIAALHDATIELDRLARSDAEAGIAEARRDQDLNLLGLGALLGMSLLVGVVATITFKQRREAIQEYRALAAGIDEWFVPAALPQVEGLSVTGRYSPAAEYARAGGDWYDVHQLDGKLVCTIGDVVGHGTKAAAAMARTRYVLLGVTDGDAAASIDLERLDSRLNKSGGMATVAHVIVDRDAGRLLYSLAGHPPPLVRHGDGRVEVLNGAVGPPVGIGMSGSRPESSCRFLPGSTLLLYTDGLIEEPGTIITDCIAQLETRFAEVAAGDLESVAESLLTWARGQERDDVALLLVRFESQPA